MIFFFNDTATTEIYTLSLHDALPILHPKDKITLKSKVLDEQNNVIPSQEVIFMSSNEKVATIDEKTGEVTAIGNGTVILTAQLKDNKDVKESVKTTVTDKYKVYVRVEGYDHTVLPRTERSEEHTSELQSRQYLVC